ncbi:DUF447 domain-containing protein [uncultured Methanobrevibacter sp.]|uniref:DUF447 domain-containing protein n=1 Tax=uncultured Methanobrevibacter sp. TaxID=253161 RepID=UPI002633D093|nr:DUF447 domain-containing protein [uncultured Methanobrevibacter sp.]
MNINLSSVGMEKGRQYETIITTISSEGKKNAAPIGVICTGKDTVICRIFKGSTTLENIISQREFIVNITENPQLFTLATIDNIPENNFDENNSIKNIESYFKCEVKDLIEAIKKSDPVKKDSEAIVIKAKVTEHVINKNIKAINRAMGLLIETLVNFTRIDIVDDKQKEYYLGRFQEAKRVINKVGSKEEQKSINRIKKELIKKGYSP